MTKDRSDAFKRIARHVETANSMGELVHWDVIRTQTQLSRAESGELERMVSAGVKRIARLMFGREVV